MQIYINTYLHISYIYLSIYLSIDRSIYRSNYLSIFLSIYLSESSEDPHWDHIWSCCVGTHPPEDIMLRRFLWPCHADDWELCQRFRSALNGINQQMGG